MCSLASSKRFVSFLNHYRAAPLVQRMPPRFSATGREDRTRECLGGRVRVTRQPPLPRALSVATGTTTLQPTERCIPRTGCHRSQWRRHAVTHPPPFAAQPAGTELRGYARGHAARKRTAPQPPGGHRARVHPDIAAQRDLQGRAHPAQATGTCSLLRPPTSLCRGVNVSGLS